MTGPSDVIQNFHTQC